MTLKSYSPMSIDEILKEFTISCLVQYDTYITDDVDLCNKECKELSKMTDELRERGPEARRSLLRLLDHKNKQVRLIAAKHVYPVAKQEARACLEKLAAMPFPDPQVFDARMCLAFLEERPDCLDP